LKSLKVIRKIENDLKNKNIDTLFDWVRQEDKLKQMIDKKSALPFEVYRCKLIMKLKI